MLLIPLNRGGNLERKPDKPLDSSQFASGAKLGLEEQCCSPGAPQEFHIRGKRDTASLSAGEQVLPQLAARCEAGQQPGQPEGSLPCSSPWQCSPLPAVLQSLPELIPEQICASTAQKAVAWWQLQPAPSLAVLPVLGWLTQQPSPPEGPPGQAQAVAWPSTGFQLPRLTIFPISSIREAPFIKSSTGAHQHTREKRWNHPQPLNPAASHRLRFGARATARCSPYSHLLPHCAPWN